MAESRERTAQERRKRIQLLKKLIIISLVTAIVVPCVGCILLLVRVHGLKGQLTTLEAQVLQLSDVVAAWEASEEPLPDMEEVTDEVDLTESAEQNVPPIEPTMPAAEPQPQDLSQITTETQEQPQHKVYLTFDDGPSSYTQDILDILEEYEVKATFFVVGKEGAASRERLTAIVEAGHTLGMHSYTHKYREIYASLESFSEDCIRLQDYLYQVTGVTSLYYRFPGGSSNDVSTMDIQEGIAYLHDQGIEYYDWNIASGDGGSRLLSVEELVENSMEGIAERETSILLFHDAADKRTTVEALPRIIENIQALEDTAILPITEDTEPIWHVRPKGDVE